MPPAFSCASMGALGLPALLLNMVAMNSTHVNVRKSCICSARELSVNLEAVAGSRRLDRPVVIDTATEEESLKCACVRTSQPG